MKFEIGDETDKKLVQVLFHEFVMCEKAFDEFLIHAAMNIMGNSSTKVKLDSYNSYSVFLARLYEFYAGCFKRNSRNAKSIDHETLDSLFVSEAEKLMRNRRYAIEKGRAPSWENHISYYQEEVPSDFGGKFREIRNNTSHTDYRRAGGERIDLMSFNKTYHKFVHLIYDSALFSWSGKTHKDHKIDHVERFNFISGT